MGLAVRTTDTRSRDVTSIGRRVLRLVFNDTMVTGLAILGACTVLSVVITVITWLSHRKRFEIDIGYFDYLGLLL